MPTRQATEPQSTQVVDLRHAVMDIAQASTDVSTLTVEGSVIEAEVVEEAVHE
ncbi:hypothetical protein [Streptomyces sp. NRRL F-4489]|uniref:hypothetical protein n=1 Tax=Streptomyces sp. NRRL F-4489 TaxID=1609095 RepID=UPI000A90B52F|nr:hypothetical protein [Streptomyces sp. NRRL F-4489]